MCTTSQVDMSVFEQISTAIGNCKSPRHIKFNCQQAFAGINLCGKSMLEIGAGQGILSVYAATHGGRKVVALEPEASGSMEGDNLVIQRLKKKFCVPNLEIINKTIQEYDSNSHKFDIVLLWNSIMLILLVQNLPED